MTYEEILVKFNLTSLIDANLRGADLSDADLRRADLSGADLSRANLTGANLTGADLRFADLRHTYLNGAHLNGVNLRGAQLRLANLRHAFLNGAQLRRVDLRGADLSHAIGYKDGGIDPRGYHFRAVLKEGNDDIEITAGCRRFNLEEAKEHWKNNKDALDRVMLMATLLG